MGLNLDVDHVAFASDRKFDGYQYRRLSAAELAQIAGRAGRHMRDGTFGVTGRAEPFEDPLVEALEAHRFDAVKVVQWRNRDLDFASIDALKASLEVAPQRQGLTKAPPSVDVDALDRVARDPEVVDLATTRQRISLLWDVCQVPDYRKIAPANHAELVTTLFGFIARDGVISEDWFSGQVAFADHTDGDIDTLANRIAHIRTWTFAANRPDWLRDPYHWQERTRAIEDRLSDALHERLTARFVDRRTSVLMRRLKENAMLEAEITATGDVMVEGQHVGNLDGFRFALDPNATDGPETKALRAAAQKALAGEIVNRAEKVANAANGDFVLSGDGALRWQGTAIAKLTEGDDALKPRLILLADEGLPTPQRERVQARIDLWLTNHIETLLKPLVDLRNAETLAAQARGIAFRLSENFGVIERSEIADEVKALDQDTRATLRALGVRFGAYHIYVPALLKPAPSALLATLWALKNGGLDVAGLPELTRLAASGRTSVPVEDRYAKPLYRIVGYKLAGTRAVRIDILERLADIIRPLIAWRPTAEQAEPPAGAINGYGFTATVSMTSLLGCSGEDFASVLRALGYRVERKPVPAKSAVPETAVTPTVDATLAAEPPESAAAEAPAPEAAAPESTPAAETTPAEADAAAAAPAEAAAEPQFIEIWRPGRKERDQHPPRHHRRPQRQPKSAAAAPAENKPAAEANSTTTEQAQPQHHNKHRRHDRREDGERRDRRPRPEGRREQRDRDDRREDRSRREQRAEPVRFSTEAPRGDKRNRPADPNSPFAALAALKAELEAKERGG
jgi:ATP-dependent RNA helicase SUPV3L1/SUV3